MDIINKEIARWKARRAKKNSNDANVYSYKFKRAACTLYGTFFRCEHKYTRAHTQREANSEWAEESGSCNKCHWLKQVHYKTHVAHIKRNIWHFHTSEASRLTTMALTLCDLFCLAAHYYIYAPNQHRGQIQTYLLEQHVNSFRGTTIDSNIIQWQCCWGKDRNSDNKFRHTHSISDLVIAHNWSERIQFALTLNLKNVNSSCHHIGHCDVSGKYKRAGSHGSKGDGNGSDENDSGDSIRISLRIRLCLLRWQMKNTQS